MTFQDNYKDISGWIHDYYCDKDGEELIFDLNNNKFFECPLCHFKYTDEKRKRAWITKYRYLIFDLLEEYSNKQLIEPKDIQFIEKALNYYSLNYDKFPIHDKNGNINTSNRCGKITAQGLNEAMISIHIASCIDNLPSIDKKIINNVLTLLFPQIFTLLKPQVNKVHNIECYEICSIAIMGLISKNQELLNFAFNSPFSFYKQIEEGVSKDYIWFEGSFHYHLFILEPILKVLKYAQKYNYPLPKKYYHIAKMMLIKIFKLSFKDCSLPSPNDTWPNKHLTDYLHVFYLGNEIWPNKFNNIIKAIKNHQNNSKTIHAFKSGFSNIKNKNWEVFIKYHDINTNHAHPDKLNIEIKGKKQFLTHDLATSGYGTTISKDFYKKTYAHNTIVIDGENQNLECESIIHSFNNHMLDVEVKNIYHNTNIRRKIKVFSHTLNDYISIQNKENKNIDYIFHCDATLITKLQTKKSSLLKEYLYFKNVKEVITNNSITLKWELNKEIITSTINLENKKLYISNSPDNPHIKDRTTLIIRSNNNNPEFLIKWNIK